LEGITYIVTPTGFLDKNGNKRKVSDDFADRIGKAAYLQANFGDSMNSSTMIEGKALLPDGRGFDRKTNKFLTKEETKALENALKV